MANWLQKIRLPVPVAQKSQNLPVVAKTGSLPMQAESRAPQDKLSNASVVYGMAASALCVVALYFFFIGLWFTGVLVLLPACCFLGFALHFLKAG